MSSRHEVYCHVLRGSSREIQCCLSLAGVKSWYGMAVVLGWFPLGIRGFDLYTTLTNFEAYTRILLH